MISENDRNNAVEILLAAAAARLHADFGPLGSVAVQFVRGDRSRATTTNMALACVDTVTYITLGRGGGK